MKITCFSQRRLWVIILIIDPISASAQHLHRHSIIHGHCQFSQRRKTHLRIRDGVIELSGKLKFKLGVQDPVRVRYQEGLDLRLQVGRYRGPHPKPWASGFHARGSGMYPGPHWVAGLGGVTLHGGSLLHHFSDIHILSGDQALDVSRGMVGFAANHKIPTIPWCFYNVWNVLLELKQYIHVQHSCLI